MDRDTLLAQLADRIAGVARRHPIRVAIDGVDGAGKTVMADQLVHPIERLGRSTIRASVDGFHNPRDVRYRRGADSPQGFYHDSYNYSRLIEYVLEPLGPGGSRLYRSAAFDHRTDSVVQTPLLHAPDYAVLLLDGIFLHRPELRDYWDFSLFLRVNFDVTWSRMLDRDGPGNAARSEDVLRPFRQRWEDRYVRGQELYLSEAEPERWASVVIDNNVPGDAELVERR